MLADRELRRERVVARDEHAPAARDLVLRLGHLLGGRVDRPEAVTKDVEHDSHQPTISIRVSIVSTMVVKKRAFAS